MLFYWLIENNKVFSISTLVTKKYCVIDILLDKWLMLIGV